MVHSHDHLGVAASFVSKPLTVLSTVTKGATSSYNSAVTVVTIGHQYTAQCSPKGNGSWPSGIPLANLTVSQFLHAYHTKYIPDYGDVWITYDAFALKVGPPGSLNDTMTLRTAMAGLSYDNLATSWLSIAAHRIEALDVPTLSPPGDFYVDMRSVLFPLSLLPGNGPFDFLERSNWATLYNDPASVPPFHIPFIRATKLEDGSKAQVILPWMLIVIACNILNVMVMWHLWCGLSDEVMTTVGDAVQSFLRRPDRRQPLIDAFKQEHNRRTALISMVVETRGNERRMSLRPRRQEQKQLRVPRMPSDATYKPMTRMCPPAKLKDHPPLIWDGQTVHGGQARLVYGSTSRWSTKWSRPIAIFIGLPILATSMWLFGMPAPSKSRPWGTASRALLDLESSQVGSSSVLLNIWIVNAPQLGLSMLYILFNNHLTRFCLAEECNTLGKTKKPLRVTKPVGEQRSTHFLQLPYRYAIPLTTFAGVLHWLMSQAMFLQRLEMRDGTGDLIPRQSYCTIGWSSSSTLALIGVLGLGIAAISVQGFSKEHVRLPPAVDCSLAISAACHPPPDDVDAHLKPVHWGVIRSRFSGVKHCSITSQDVDSPDIGEQYA